MARQTVSRLVSYAFVAMIFISNKWCTSIVPFHALPDGARLSCIGGAHHTARTMKAQLWLIKKVIKQ